MRRTLWMTALAALAAVGTARADEPLAITGFATANYTDRFGPREAQFTVSEVELDGMRTLGPEGSARVDLEWVWDGNAWLAQVEQGFLVYRPRRLERLAITAGRFNAPMGFESLDPPDMYQVSHGLLFTYCAPSNLTGAMAGADLGRGLDLQAYAVNGWDLNAENNGSPTFGGRLAWAGTDRVSGGLSAISGKRDPGQRLRESVLDADLSVHPGAGLLLGAELNGCRARRDGADASWAGFMVMAHWTVVPELALTGRFDHVNDNNGLLFESGRTERRSSGTLASEVTLGPGMLWFTELRWDKSDAKVFPDHDGTPKSSALTGALSMTYSF